MNPKYPCVLFALGLLWLTHPVEAAPSPKQTIQQSAEEVRTILRKKIQKGSAEEKKQKDALKKAVDRFLDYPTLAQRSLGPHWDTLNPKQREEFGQLLRDLIEGSYTSAIQSNIDFTLTYDAEEIKPDGSGASISAVACAKSGKGKTVSEDLTFYLHLKDRKWMVYDLEFGDVSLVRHYRGEFNRKIKKDGYPALLAAMKKKLDEIRSGKIKVEKKPTL